STECLIQLTKLGYDATPFKQILKQNAKREMRLRLGKVTVADVLAAQPVTTHLIKFMSATIKMIVIKHELLLIVYELKRSGLLAENEKIRPILAQLEKLLLCDLSPSTNDSVKNRHVGSGEVAQYAWLARHGLA